MQVQKVNVAVIGCGTICKRTYMPNMMSKFNIINVVGCADLIDERAQAMADQYGIKKMTNEEIYNDPSIEIVVNLTYPESHYEVTKASIEHGKNVYCEKMMASNFAEAKELADLAEKYGVMYTTAPDTFLGASAQSARFYLDAGLIGKPVSVHAQHNCSYQPASEFFDVDADHFFFPLHRGGGLPFDWGGYYLHAIINMLGSMTRVTGFGGTLNPHRPYTHPRHPKYKEDFFVDTPTSLWGAMEFENGCHGTFNITSDGNSAEFFELVGTEGTLVLGCPNNFAGDLILRRPGSNPGTDVPQMVIPVGQLPPKGAAFMAPPVNEGSGNKPGNTQLGERAWVCETKLPLLHGYYSSSRGVGVADMCYALRNNRRPRAHYDIGLHAIECIHGILTAGETNQTYQMTTRCERPAMIPISTYAGTGQEASLDN